MLYSVERLRDFRIETTDKDGGSELLSLVDVLFSDGDMPVRAQRRWALGRVTRGPPWEAALVRAEAELARLRDGAWAEEIEVARAELERAASRVESTELLIERRTVRAPIAGTILKRNIEPGEHASPSAGEAALVLADLSALMVRARVNEEHMPPEERMASAIARPRGRADQEIPLRLHAVEPLAIPKRSLTGAPAELVDTRVVEVLFKMERKPDPRVVPGRLVDVFIELTEVGQTDEQPEGQTGEQTGEAAGGDGSSAEDTDPVTNPSP